LDLIFTAVNPTVVYQSVWITESPCLCVHSPNTHRILNINQSSLISQTHQKLRNLLDVGDELVLFVNALLALYCTWWVDGVCSFGGFGSTFMIFVHRTIGEAFFFSRALCVCGKEDRMSESYTVNGLIATNEYQHCGEIGDGVDLFRNNPTGKGF
jgi:hypothetical protein